MSGGSMAYCYEEILSAAKQTSNPIVAQMLRDAADLLHDEEWAISSDISQSDYENTMKVFTKKWIKKRWRKKMRKGVIE